MVISHTYISVFKVLLQYTQYWIYLSFIFLCIRGYSTGNIRLITYGLLFALLSVTVILSVFAYSIQKETNQQFSDEQHITSFKEFIKSSSFSDDTILELPKVISFNEIELTYSFRQLVKKLSIIYFYITIGVFLQVLTDNFSIIYVGLPLGVVYLLDVLIEYRTKFYFQDSIKNCDNTASINAYIEEITDDMNIQQNIEAIILEDIPFTAASSNPYCGQPKIILSKDFLFQQDYQKEIIAHELAHIKYTNMNVFLTNPNVLRLAYPTLLCAFVFIQPTVFSVILSFLIFLLIFTVISYQRRRIEYYVDKIAAKSVGAENMAVSLVANSQTNPFLPDSAFKMYLDLFSTHPKTSNRIKQLEKLSSKTDFSDS